MNFKHKKKIFEAKKTNTRFNQCRFWSIDLFLWSASANHSCVHMRHPENLTICARRAPCTTLISMQWHLYVNFYLHANYWKKNLCVCLDSEISTHLLDEKNPGFFFFTCVRISIDYIFHLLKVKCFCVLLFRKSKKIVG